MNHFPVEPTGHFRRLIDAQSRRRHLHVVRASGGSLKRQRLAAVRVVLYRFSLRLTLAAAIVGYVGGALVMLGEVAGQPIITIDVTRAFLIGISMGMLTWIFVGARIRLDRQQYLNPTLTQEEETNDAAV